MGHNQRVCTNIQDQNINSSTNPTPSLSPNHVKPTEEWKTVQFPKRKSSIPTNPPKVNQMQAVTQLDATPTNASGKYVSTTPNNLHLQNYLLIVLILYLILLILLNHL